MTFPSKYLRWLLAVAAALGVALLAISPALASDAISGDNVVIDEDYNDDLYVFGNTITVNSTIDGDLIVFGTSLTLNGTVTGDLLFAGQWLILNGEVQDDARIGGMTLVIGEDATIGDDLNAGGFALEMRSGSRVGGDALFGAAQVVLADVDGNISGGAEGVRIEGTIRGDANLSVGSASDTAPVNPAQFMFIQSPGMPQVASIPAGLSFGTGGRVEGDLSVESPAQPTLPQGVLGGEFTYQPLEEGSDTPLSRPFGAFALGSLLRRAGFFVMTFLIMLLVGGLLQRFTPSFLEGASETLRTRWLSSFGVGLVGYVAFFVIAFLGFFLVLFGFVLLPLGGAGPFFNLLALVGTTLINAFTLATRWLGPILVAILIGTWVYALINREKKAPFWSLVIGALIVSLVLAVPLLGRPVIGSLLRIFGLGAVILTLWPRTQSEAPATTEQAAT